MVFAYPLQPPCRKHGPAGYTDYTSYKEWLRDEFCFRCVYCLERERWYPSGAAGFGVDHFRPRGLPEYAALLCVYENMGYACNRCNSAKRDPLLPYPCLTAFGGHLQNQEDGRVEGLTLEGNVLIETLGLNRPEVREVRVFYRTLLQHYRDHPDDPEVRHLYLSAFGFPADLPHLDALRPPSNSRPEGLAQSHYQQRLKGQLPETY